MNKALMALLAAALLLSPTACRDDRDDERVGEDRQRQLDTVRGTPTE